MKSYAFGIDSLLKDAPVEAVGAFTNLIPIIAGAINTVSNAKNTVQYPITQQQQITSFAMGGTVDSSQVPINVEGGEIVKKPDGTQIEMEGAKHEQGGIDTQAPEGTVIYSDRLKVDGKTLAERQKARAKKELNLAKLLEGDEYDAITKNTLTRVSTQNRLQDDKDKQMMVFANQLEEQVDTINKFMNGGMVKSYANGTPELEKLPLRQLPTTLESIGIGLPNAPFGQVESTGDFSSLFDIQPLPITKDNRPALPTNNNTTSSSDTPDEDSSLLGNQIGTAGAAFSAIAPLATTLANRAGDKANTNFYKTVGNRALSTLDTAEANVNSQQELAERENRLLSNTMSVSNRNNAGSVNTLRAIDSASTTQLAENNSKIVDNFLQQLTGIAGQKANVQQQSDVQNAQAETQRETFDKQDRDAFYTNLGRNLNNIGTVAQTQGKMLNETQSNNDQLDVMSQMSAYGLKFKRVNGKLVLVNK